MSKIEELIQQYCPDGVEYVPLGSVCEIGTGSHNTQDGMHEGKYTFYTRGSDVLYLNDFDYDETAIITAGDGAGVGKVFHFVNGKYALHQRAYRIVPDESKILARYVYHYFGATFYDYIMKSSVSSSVVSIRKPMMLNYPIPLPPLPVQEEIVRILDTFTELQAELQAEQQARQLQYQFYRDQLFAFDGRNDIKWKKLGEVGTLHRGNGLQKKDFTETGVGCIHYGQIYTKYGAYTDKTLTFVDETLSSRLLQVEKGNIVIACTSENVDDICKCVAWLGEDNICTGGHACVFRHNENPKYVSYFFQTEQFFKQKIKYVYGTKVMDIKPDNLAKIEMPLPSLEEQNKIVDILDKLYTLTYDLSQGLPAEIEARKQQYEYYRDQLLTFKKKEA